MVIAFLDIYPVALGHVLVPKQRVPFVWNLPEKVYQAVMAVVKRITQHQRAVLEVPYVGQQIIGADVPHAHIHLIPFTEVAEYRYEPDMQAEPDYEALAVMAETLRLT